jgi:hypothetical protein
LRTKLFWPAQAWISVPSTEKCSSDRSRSERASSSTRWKKASAMSPHSSRSRFLVEDGHVPHLVVHAQPDKAAKEQIVLQLFHQEPLAAHRVEGPEAQRWSSFSGALDGRSVLA